MTGIARNWLISAFIATSAVVAGFGFDNCFTASQLVPAVFASALLPSALVTASTLAARPVVRHLGLVAALAVLLVIGPVIAFRSLLSPHLLSRGWAGILNGWSQLLTTVLPAPASGTLLMSVIASVWVASWAGTALGLRNTPLVLALLPSYAVLVVAALLSAHGSGVRLVWFVLELAITLAGLVVLQGSRTRLDSGRRLAATIIAMVTVVAGAAGVARLDTRTPYDPSDSVATPVVPYQGVNLLSFVPNWLAHPATPLFTVEAPAEVKTRLITFDEYDGQSWDSSSKYRASGGSLSASASPPPASARPVHAKVEVTGLPGPWLPVPNSTRQVTGVLPIVDPAGDTVAMRDRPASGASYAVDFDEPKLPEVAFADAAAAPTTDIETPSDMPAALAGTARAVTERGTTAGAKALLLERYLQSEPFVSSLSPPPGLSEAQAAQLVATLHSGSYDQYASAFALMAREVGLPTRLVMGFGAGTTVGPHRHLVRSGDVLVWPEVDLAGLGWTPFYPYPTRRDTTTTALPLPLSTPTDVSRLQADGKGLQTIDHPPQGTGQTGTSVSHHKNRSWWPLILLGMIGLLIVGYPAGCIGIRRLATRRLHALTGPFAAQAAWDVLRIELWRSWRLDSAAMTVDETVAAVHRVSDDAGPAIRTLGNRVDDMIYAGRAAPHQLLWAECDRAVQAVRTARSGWQRSIEACSPRQAAISVRMVRAEELRECRRARSRPGPPRHRGSYGR